VILLLLGAFAAAWWFGWFRPVANTLGQIKRHTVSARP
jgi:hypothetical protein